MRKAIAFLVSVFIAASAATPVLANTERVETREEFVNLIQGKRLTRPFVDLQVTPTGGIVGRGAAWDVRGEWSWQDGFFCRDLEWGGDPLGYNCQLVTAQGNKITFTSDKGAGRSAGFTLR